MVINYFVIMNMGFDCFELFIFFDYFLQIVSKSLYFNFKKVIFLSLAMCSVLQMGSFKLLFCCSEVRIVLLGYTSFVFTAFPAGSK